MERDNSIVIKKEIFGVLEKLHLDLEPIRDKALDEKARLTGYSQCIEQIIKIILSRENEIKKEIEQLENEPKVVAAKVKSKSKK